MVTGNKEVFYVVLSKLGHLKNKKSHLTVTMSTDGRLFLEVLIQVTVLQPLVSWRRAPPAACPPSTALFLGKQRIKRQRVRW